MAKGGAVVVGLIVVAAVVAGGVYYEKNYAVPTNVAYVTEENGKIDQIDLSTMKIARTIQPPDLAPRGLAVTYDGKYLITAAKDTSDIAIFSTPQLKLVAREHTGDNPEFIKLNPAGDRVFSTFEPGSSGGPPPEVVAMAPAAKSGRGKGKDDDDKSAKAGRGKDADDKSAKAGAAPAAAGDDDDDDANEPPAQIASFSVGTWTPGPVSVAGQETEGVEFSPDGKYMIVCNEAQNNIGIYDAASGQLVRNVDLKQYGLRPRDIKVSPLHNEYTVTMEASGTLAKLDMDFNVLKTVQTAAKPYGESFDRSGKRVFVAAAMARKLQVFDADSLNLLAEVPIGARCWHFTFTPDDSKILMACGRSNNIVIVDPSAYKQIGTIEGLNLPWGIVTYPRAFGSLGLP
jgi:DNA-binding beta-propeller fold protein YncE